nr:hypothetical protein [uncultured Glaciecola sp.]
MSKLDKDSVLAKFTAAYEAANGKAPTIEAKGGWYSVDGGKNIRLAQLDEMADNMGSAPAPKKAKAEKPAKEAKIEKPKAAKPKAPAKTKAKKSASSFSVKDFYTKQIQDTNPGAKAPR